MGTVGGRGFGGSVKFADLDDSLRLAKDANLPLPPFFEAWLSTQAFTLEEKDRQWKVTRAPNGSKIFPNFKLPSLWVNLFKLSKDWFC